MPRRPSDARAKQRPSILADAFAVLGEAETTGTIFLIALTALVCCVAVGPSWEIVAPLGGLAVFRFVAALKRRRSRSRR